MSLDCDDAMLLIAASRTLTGREETHLGSHLAECADCRALRVETSEEWRWVARMPQDAFDDPDLLVFPVVDPIVFQAGQVIASGGMGRITRVTDRRLGREVALKESLEDTLRSRFEREAAITARLQHPSIVPIYEAGSWPDGSLFYTMRLVDGVDLAGAIGNTETLEERIALLPHVVKVTEALAYAHARKIIHRDLKPSNVLVGAYGETVVIDWGIAKELGRTIDDAKLPQLPSKDGLTRSGTILGTPCFMAPEQARGEMLDERADVYALGALLYNLLAGEPPYWDRFKSAELIVEYSILHPPTPILELAPGTPADLVAIVERAMARAPADRYRDAREMAEELRRFEAGQLIAREYTLRELARRWLSKHRTAVTIVAIALSVLAVIAVIAVINVRSSRDAEAAARREAETNLATARIAGSAMLEEQARTEILAGDRARGLVYASATYAQGRDTPALRYLLEVARRDGVLQLSEIGPPDITTACGREPNCSGSDTQALGYDAAGNLVVVETEGQISTWNAGKRTAVIALGAGVGSARLAPAATRAAIIAGTAFTMWDVATGKQAWSITDPILDGLRVDVSFDPSGTYVVAVSDDPEQKGVALREAATGKVVGELVVGSRAIKAIAFSPDGARVAACNNNGEVRVWTIAGFTELATWLADAEPDAIAFAGADRILIDSQVSATRTVSLWALDKPPRLVRLLGPHDGPFPALAASPDGALIATSDASSLRLWNREGEQLAESRLASARYETLLFTPTTIVGQAIDHRLFVFERATLAARTIVDAHDGPVDQIAIDAAGTRIATAASDQHIREWQFPHGPVRAQFATGATVFLGDRLAVATPTGIQLYRADTTAPAGTIEVALGTPTSLAAAGDTLLASGASGQFAIDSRGTARKLAETTELELSHDGRFALAEDADDDPPTDGLRVWDMAKGTLARAFPIRWDSAVVVRDTLVVVRNRGVSIYDVATGRKIGRSQLPGTQDTYALELSPSGKILLARNILEIVRLDQATGAEIARMPAKTTIEDVLFAGDLVFSIHDSGAWAWDLPTGKLRTRVDRSATVLDVSRDGLIAAAGANHVRLWDRATGQQLDAIDVVHDNIEHVTFDPTGKRLLVTTKAASVLLDVALATDGPATFEALAKRLPWKLEQGVAVPR